MKYFDYGYFPDYGTWHIQCINEHINEHTVDTSLVVQFKVTGYLEETWFKKNFAKVFSACSYSYASVERTTCNAASFGSLWNKLALQSYLIPYILHGCRDRHVAGILFKL